MSYFSSFIAVTLRHNLVCWLQQELFHEEINVSNQHTQTHYLHVQYSRFQSTERFNYYKFSILCFWFKYWLTDLMVCDIWFTIFPMNYVNMFYLQFVLICIVMLINYNSPRKVHVGDTVNQIAYILLVIEKHIS